MSGSPVKLPSILLLLGLRFGLIYTLPDYPVGNTYCVGEALERITGVRLPIRDGLLASKAKETDM